MKKTIAIFLFFLLFQTSFANSENYENKINKIIENKDNYKSLILLKKINNSKNLNKGELKNIIESKITEITNQIELDENEIKEKIIGKSYNGNDIKIYYKGNPNLPFTLFISNIHGGYEPSTYFTSIFLLDELKKSNKKQWILIETLNPDGLNKYLQEKDKNKDFLEYRLNGNGIDVNRNFCTNDYKAGTYTKKSTASGKKIIAGMGKTCNSEPETIAIQNIINDFNIKQAIDLHSQGGILFIPDFSIDDKRIIELGNKIKKGLGNSYIFNISYKNEIEKKKKIKQFEADSGGEGIYTGMLINYLYSKYDIPTIIIELKTHKDIEKNIVNLIEII